MPPLSRPGRLCCLPLVLLAALACISPRDAVAGAWTKEPGRSQIIVTGGLNGGDFGMLGTGGGGGEGKAWMQIFGEHGLRDGLTAGGKLYLEGEREEDGMIDGAASLGAHVRKRVWQDSEKGAVAALQVEGQVPIERLLGPEIARSAPFSTTEVGLRGLYGRSWWGDWGSAFVSTEAAGTWRSEGQSPDVRSQVTAGYQPGSRWLAMLSVSSLVPFEDTGTDPSLVLRPSVAMHFAETADGHRSTVQLGMSYDLLDSDRGPGVFMSVWRSF